MNNSYFISNCYLFGYLEIDNLFNLSSIFSLKDSFNYGTYLNSGNKFFNKELV